MKSHNDPRLIAFEVLGRVEEGAFSDLALDAHLSRCRGIDSRDRALATELVYGVLRCRGRLDFALGYFCKQRLDKLDPSILQILRLGAYQLLHLDRVPERAAVHECVEMAHRLKLSRASGFVNGVLRSLARQKSQLPWPDPYEKTLEYLVHCRSLPSWMASLWQTQLGDDEALDLAGALMSQAPLTLRANTLRNERRELGNHLAGQGYQARNTTFAPEGLTLDGSHAMKELAVGLEEGRFLIQDEASMLISHLLAPRKGDRILDACAAPGGKTTHLAALTGNQAHILALDLHEKRLGMVDEGAVKLGCQGIETKLWDMMTPPAFLENDSFDRILVDAPCSGLGVMRRNPEIRWRRNTDDIAELARIQNAILDNAASLVRIGGTLLYSVCTFTPEETKGVIKKFLKRHPAFVPVDLRPLFPSAWEVLFDAEGNLRTWPHRHNGMDAFFAARLERQTG